MSKFENLGGAYQYRRWMKPNAQLWMRPDAHRWTKQANIGHSGEGYQRKYDPDQPRVPVGSADGGRWTSDHFASPDASEILFGASDDSVVVAGQVIRICLRGSYSISFDRFGNRTWWAEYICADGRSFIFQGFGSPGPQTIRIDPVQ